MALVQHPTAIVDPEAVIGDDVTIGPFCTIGPNVRLGDGVRLHSHVVLDGFTEVGDRAEFYPFACIGTKTQDLKYQGGRPGVRIGARTVIRENVTVNAATYDGDLTIVGDDCLLMAYSHVAHDCRLGNRVIMANCATLAGHITVDDDAIIGGLSGVHQFVRIGRMVMIGGCSKVVKDVPPFMLADGHPLEVRGINRIGLERKGVDADGQHALKEAYRIIYRRGLTTAESIESVRNDVAVGSEISELIEFIEKSERGITK